MIGPRSNISFAEFIEWERAQPERHELVGGRISYSVAVPSTTKRSPSTLLQSCMRQSNHPAESIHVRRSCRLLRAREKTVIGRISPYRVRLRTSGPACTSKLRSLSSRSRHRRTPATRGTTNFWNTGILRASSNLCLLIRASATSRRIGVTPRVSWGPLTIIESDGRLEFAVVSIDLTLAAMYAGTSLAIMPN